MRGAARVLDVFSGSGCIGIAVLKAVPSAHVDFAELNPAFVEQIKLNLGKNGIPKKRYRVYRSDVFRDIPPRAKYDYILANPPYIGEGDPVDGEVLKWEPHGALFAGKDGLRYIRRLLREAPARLAPGGKLYFEFAPYEKERIEKLWVSDTDKVIHRFRRDQYGRWRYAVMSRSK